MVSKIAPKQADRPPILEWIVAGLGLIGTSLAFGVILMQALDGPDTPPDLRLAAGEVRPTESGWVVEIEAFNHGDQTAAGVHIEGRLGIETASAELDYVPAHGRSTASFLFDEDPRKGIELTVLGWREP